MELVSYGREPLHRSSLNQPVTQERVSFCPLALCNPGRGMETLFRLELTATGEADVERLDHFGHRGLMGRAQPLGVAAHGHSNLNVEEL